MTDPIAAARAAGARKPTTSPYAAEERKSFGTKVIILCIWVTLAMSAMRLDGLLAAALWGFLTGHVFVVLLGGPASRKLRRRRDLMARQQVHMVRQLDPGADPVGFGMGDLHDASPGLDRESALAGAVFAIARAHHVLDDVEATTPKATIFGKPIDDTGKATNA